MADVFHENSDLEIGKDDVFDNDDVAELKEWLEEQRDTAAELVMMLGALKLSPTSDTNGLARKLGYVNISMAWITKRLKQLGVSKEEIAGDHEAGIRKQLRILEGVVQQHKAKIKALNIENSEMRHKLFLYERSAAA